MGDLSVNQEYFVVDIEDRRLLDFYAIFGNTRPITLEIGFGKGEYIAVNSRFHPERNFLGIELKMKRVITTLKKLDIQKNSNVRLMRLFVDSGITEVIPAGSIDEVIIYHPDPWPKKRHHRRRMFQHSFVDALNPILRAGGYLKVSTDSTEYAEWIADLFAERDDFENMYCSGDVPIANDTGYSLIIPEYHLTTYFDKLQSEAGFDTKFLLYKKVKEI